MRSIDRRSVLMQGFNAATASAAALSTPPAVAAAFAMPEPSQLFRDYLAARTALVDAYRTLDVKTETPAGKALQRIVDDALSGAIDALKARRPSSLQEMIELAQVAANEMATDWAVHSDCTYEFEESLARGLLALAEGGAHAA